MQLDNKSRIQLSERDLAEQNIQQALRAIQQATKRKGFDPKLKKSVEGSTRFVTAADPKEFRDALVMHYAQIAHPETDQDLIEQSIEAMSQVKNALVLRNMDHTLKGILIKTSAASIMATSDLVELLGEEFGHVVGYYQRKPVSQLQASCQQHLQIIDYMQKYAITAEETSIEGYNSHLIRDGYVVAHVPLHGYLEELRAQALGLYIRGHAEGQQQGIHFNKAVLQSRALGRSLYPSVDDDMKREIAKGEYLYRICDGIGWDNIIPVFTQANLDRFYGMLNTDKTGTVMPAVNHFIEIESQQMQI